MSRATARKRSDVVSVLLRFENHDGSCIPIHFPGLPETMFVVQFIDLHANVHPDVPQSHKGGVLLDEHEKEVELGDPLWLCRADPADDDLAVIFTLKPRQVAPVPASVDVLNTVKHSHLAPSTFAMLKNLVAHQQLPTPLVACFRPAEDYEPIPPWLLVPAFAELVDNLETCTPSREEIRCATELCQRMATFYKTELDRNETFRRVLNTHVLYPMGVPLQQSTVRKKRTTDGRNLAALFDAGKGDASFVAPLLICVVKPEMGIGSAEPNMQATQYYAQLINEIDAKWRSTCILPAMYVSLAGTFLSFGCLYWLEDSTRAVGERFIVSYPIGVVNLIFNTRWDKYMEHVARTIASISRCVKSMKLFYSSIAAARGTASLGLPLPLEATLKNGMAVDPVEGDRVLRTYTIIRRLRQDKLLFWATSSDNQRVLVKYTDQYGTNAHRLCTAQNIAPRLLDVIQLAGPHRIAVVMEYLDAADGWQPLANFAATLKHGESLPDALCSSLGSAYASMTEELVVHGDLHSANIMIRPMNGDWEVKFIDFDWAYAGEEAQTKYPLFINLDGLDWHPHVAAEAWIEAEHDKWLIEKFVGKKYPDNRVTVESAKKRMAPSSPVSHSIAAVSCPGGAAAKEVIDAPAKRLRTLCGHKRPANAVGTATEVALADVSKPDITPAMPGSATGAAPIAGSKRSRETGCH